eukprot:5854707-Alexandrium_andersonii.AAC.1
MLHARQGFECVSEVPVVVQKFTLLYLPSPLASPPGCSHRACGSSPPSHAATNRSAATPSLFREVAWLGQAGRALAP